MKRENRLPGIELKIAGMLFLVFFFSSLLAQDINSVQKPGSTLPCPKLKNMLFYLQRDPDANTVVYELNFKSDGTLHSENPVKGSWIRYTENGQRKELNAVENRFAYGVQCKAMDNGEYKLMLVSYKKMPLYLKKFGDTYKVYAMFNKIPVIMSRVFVRVKGGSFLFPDIQYIELTGSELATGNEISHRIKM